MLDLGRGDAAGDLPLLAGCLARQPAPPALDRAANLRIRPGLAAEAVAQPLDRAAALESTMRRGPKAFVDRPRRAFPQPIDVESTRRRFCQEDLPGDHTERGVVSGHGHDEIDFIDSLAIGVFGSGCHDLSNSFVILHFSFMQGISISALLAA